MSVRSALWLARVDGFDLEATTVVREDDRDRLEQLARYSLRPALADHRLRLLRDGRAVIRSPWRLWAAATP